MGRRGPAPAPTKVLEMRGSRRAKKQISERKNEVRPKVVLPKPPKRLGKDAIEHWERIGGLLVEHGLVTELDVDMLAELAQAIDDVDRFEAETRGNETFLTPNGYVQRHPNTVLLREARERLIKLSARFGLSPSDRARLADEGHNREESGNPFAINGK